MSSLPRRNITRSTSRETWTDWADAKASFDQKFASHMKRSHRPETLLSPLTRDLLSRHSSLKSEMMSTGASNVKNNFTQFQIFLDVSQFRSYEINVKTIGQEVVVHAKHPERHDEHGIVSREFTRRYPLPLEVDPLAVTALYDSKGILAITADKKLKDAPGKETLIKVEKPFKTQGDREDAARGGKHDIQRQSVEGEGKKEATASPSASATSTAAPTSRVNAEAREKFFKCKTPHSSSGTSRDSDKDNETKSTPEVSTKYYESKSVYSSSSSIHTTTSVKSSHRPDQQVTDV